MDVFEAVESRASCRAFLDRPVDAAVVRDLIGRAARAASSGNLQPWLVHAFTGEPLRTLVRQVGAALPDVDPRELAGGDHPVYPEPLFEPLRRRRLENGLAMYRALGIARDDVAGRRDQFLRNYTFFGAPVGLFLTLDRRCGPGQWADVGGYLATFMLLARGHGLATCAQASWARVAPIVRPLIGLPDNELLVCGIALGHPDPDAPVNRFHAARAPLAEFARLHGFAPA